MLRRAPLLVVLCLLVRARAWAHDHDHGADADAAPDAAAQAASPASSASPEAIAVLDKRWNEAHARVHRYLDAEQDEHRRDPLLYDVVRRFDDALERFHTSALSKHPDDPKILRDVIRSAELAQPLIDLGEKAGEVRAELASAPPERHAELERRRDELGDKMDALLIQDFPKDFHYGYLMHGKDSITDALLELGLPLRHFSEHGGMGESKSPGAQDEVGRVLFNAGDMAGAETAYSKAIQTQGDDAEALTGRADARYNRGDYRGAFDDAEAALRLEPGNAAAKAVERFAAGRLGIALDAALPSEPWKADGPAPTAGDAVGAGAAAAGGAASLAGMAASAPSAESTAWTRDAAAALAMKDFSAAERALDHALGADPNDAQALHMRAGLEIATGRYADAVADAKRVLGLSPSSGALIDRLAGELSRRGRFQEAKDLTLERLRLDSGDAAAWYALARADAGLGDRDAVISDLRRAAQLDPAYAARLDAATRAPQGSDLSFLFDETDRRPAPAAPTGGRGRPDLVALIVCMVVGGFLIALGLLRVTSSPAPAAVAAGEAEERPRLIGGVYELGRQIGLGGMGIVYEAVDRSLNRRVAIKKMREEIRVDPRERERFLKEAHTVASLRHPGIVGIHAIVEEGADVYLVFEYVDGGTLYELLDRRQRLPLAEAAGIIGQAGEALAYAHSRGVIHRDLKPSNIMLATGGLVKVMDFGVARQAKDAVSKLSMTNTVVGTPPYMAPEQEQGVVRRESDVYALGVCLYELLTGNLPFQGTGAGMLINKMKKSFAPASTLAPELPPAVDAMFSRVFEPDPARRFPSVSAFLEALRSLAPSN